MQKNLNDNITQESRKEQKTKNILRNRHPYVPIYDCAED